MVEWDMVEGTYEQIDDLFVKMRLGLADIRKYDPVAAEEMKSLIIQLEDCVESLVVESLRAGKAGQGPGKATKRPAVKKKSGPAR